MEEENKKLNIENAIKKAEEIAKKYNPETFIPFPFENIDRDMGDLIIKIGGIKDENISGVLDYQKTDDGLDKFRIFVNDSKPKKRIYFTLAHELGHYFLHRDRLMEKGLVVDNGEMVEMFRYDGLSSNEETEANHFAATLIMPSDKVKEVWKMLGGIEECADFFQVSNTAMSIRLSTLGLTE